MKVRKPHFNFTQALPQWGWHRAFVQANNAASTTLSQLEPYLPGKRTVPPGAFTAREGRYAFHLPQ